MKSQRFSRTPPHQHSCFTLYRSLMMSQTSVKNTSKLLLLFLIDFAVATFFALSSLFRLALTAGAACLSPRASNIWELHLSTLETPQLTVPSLKAIQASHQACSDSWCSMHEPTSEQYPRAPIYQLRRHHSLLYPLWKPYKRVSPPSLWSPNVSAERRKNLIYLEADANWQAACIRVCFFRGVSKSQVSH